MSEKLLIVLQPTLRPIDEATAKAVLSSDDLRLPSSCVTLDEPTLPMDAIRDLDWVSAQALLIDTLRTKIEPELRDGARVVYLGATPIPLAMQLGYLLGSWGRVDAYQAHHETGDWNWATSRSGAAPVATTTGVVVDLKTSAPCDVIIRLTSWPEVNVAGTIAMVPDALMAVDIVLEPRGRDVLELQADLATLANAFREVLDDLSDRLPRATFHLFAAGPVAMALELGRCVSPTRHRPVLVYQRLASDERGFCLAFELQGTASAGHRTLTHEEIATAAQERSLWNEELRALAGRAASAGTASWTDGHGALEGPPWCDLPGIAALAPVFTNVDLDRTEVDGFRFDRDAGVWLLSDDLLLAITRRLDAEADRRIAARLFFLHEGLHEQVHGLSGAMSPSVGRFPRVLEELDYQADAWALLQELKTQRESDDASGRLRKLIWIATETFWAFDAGHGPLVEIQLRRMNRYLLWYWQSLQLERCSSTAAAIETLATKPTLELAGLDLFLRGDRPVCRLDPSRASRLEIAVVEGVTLQRRPEGQPFPWSALVEGFRARDGEAVRRCLQGIADNVATSRSSRGA
jgi:hypothetical protein